GGLDRRRRRSWRQGVLEKKERKVHFGHRGFSRSWNEWPGSYGSPLNPHFRPIQVTERIFRSPDSVYSFAGIY
ncbi:hypothetical protein LINPERPRIM_LOCUS39916, partial [Linum perenne]